MQVCGSEAPINIGSSVGEGTCGAGVKAGWKPDASPRRTRGSGLGPSDFSRSAADKQET